MNRGDTYTPDLPTGGSVTTTTAFAGDGTVTITNTLASTDLYNVVVVFNKGSTNVWTPPAGVTLQNDVPVAGQITATIPKLAQGAHYDITYTVAPAATMPLTMTAAYSDNKVNIGGSTTITLTLVKNSAVIGNDINNIVVTLTPQDLNANSAKDWLFSNLNPSVGSTVLNPDGSVTWTIGTLHAADANPTLGALATENDAAAHSSTDNLALFNMAVSSVTYAVATSPSAAGVSIVGHPTAVTSKVTTDLTKQQLTGNSWQFTPKITNANTEDITFTLTSVAFYATDSGNLATSIPGADRTVTAGAPGALPYDLNQGGVWTATPFSFTYNGVPAGFIKPSISVKDDSTQIPKTFASSQGSSGVTLMKRIYVLNGYNIEVVKTITDLGAGVYQIDITATNLGSKKSPDTVLVYDIVPAAFTAHDFNPAVTGEAAGVLTPVAGHAYWWNVGPLDATGVPTDHKHIQYQVTGNGVYALSDIFLIGVDPSQSMNLQSTPLISNAATMVNANFESLAALGAAGLLVIGMIGTARRRF